MNLEAQRPAVRSHQMSLKTFRHPHVATRRGRWNGHILSVSRCDSPGWCSAPSLPNFMRIVGQIHVNKLDRQPVGLLVTNRPFESAVQSTEEKVFQFFKTSLRVGWPESDSNRMRFSPLLVIASIFPSGESPEFMLPVSSCSLSTSCGFPFIGSNTENTICVLYRRE